MASVTMTKAKQRDIAAMHEQVLDLWYHGGLPGGPTAPAIADQIGRAVELVHGVLARARERGDPRAVKRSAGGIPTLADRARRASATEAVLNLRAAKPELLSTGIARNLGLSIDIVRNIIADGRFKGDTRAAHRDPAWKREHAPGALLLTGLRGMPMDAPLRCPDLGIHAVTRRVARGPIYSTDSDADVSYTDVSVAHLVFLDGPRPEEDVVST